MDTGALDGGDESIGEDLDALLPVVGGDGVRQVGGEGAPADPGLGEDHRHLASLRAQRGGDLGADEAAADHGKARPAVGECANSAVVVERAVIDDVRLVAAEAARRSTGGEDHALVAVCLTGVVDRVVALGIERDDLPAEVEIDAALPRVAPDLRFVASFPEALRQRRTLVGGVLLLADEHDRAVAVDLTDALADGVAGHAAADHEIAIFAQRHLLDCRCR